MLLLILILLLIVNIHLKQIVLEHTSDIKI
jgi:hypothetical protein